jgi:hypothetical protein
VDLVVRRHFTSQTPVSCWALEKGYTFSATFSDVSTKASILGKHPNRVGEDVSILSIFRAQARLGGGSAVPRGMCLGRHASHPALPISNGMKLKKCNSRCLRQYSAAPGFEDLISRPLNGIVFFCYAPLFMRPHVGKAQPPMAPHPGRGVTSRRE